MILRGTPACIFKGFGEIQTTLSNLFIWNASTFIHQVLKIKKKKTSLCFKRGLYTLRYDTTWVKAKFQQYLLEIVKDSQSLPSKPSHHLRKVLRLQGEEDCEHRDEAAHLHPSAPARHKQELTNKTGSSKPKNLQSKNKR